MSELDGLSAFTELLDRYDDRIEKLGVERDRRERAEGELQTVRRDLGRAQTGLQQNRDAAVRAEKEREQHNALFKELDAFLRNGRDASPELLARVAKAILDTDEIPF